MGCDNMFKRVEAQLVMAGLTKKELAAAIGIGYNTLLTKLRGEREFTLMEARGIKEALHSEDSIELLLEKVVNSTYEVHF
jgi:hypothetical protein